MDKDGDSEITIYEYLDYFEIMLYGDKMERMKQSFDIIDIQGHGKITKKKFEEVVYGFATMWSAALGEPMPLNKKYIDSIFHKFAQNENYF